MNKWTNCAAAALATLLLVSCQQSAQRSPPAPVAIEQMPTPLPASELLPPQPAPIYNIDDYKMLVAAHILNANQSITFSGRLPPMLPAIVVVEIKVGHDGVVDHVRVVRSRDNEASRVALAAVRQGSPLPKPGHLLKRNLKTLNFSETFLFNKDYQFQLRTLAGPQ